MIFSQQRKKHLKILARLKKYNQAIKISVSDTERVIRDFAENTLLDLKPSSDATQRELSEQIRGIQKYFNPDIGDETGEVEAGDNIVTFKQFQALETKVDQLILLQKELAANVMEMNRVRQVQAQKQRAEAAKTKSTPKPPVNPLKFP